MSVPPFPADYRASGLLLHVTSLPSPYGIGDRGSGCGGVDRPASRRGASWWQALPLGPTGYGDSPYQSLSSFAGNPLADQPRLADRGRTAAGERLRRTAAFSSTAVDFDAVRQFKYGRAGHGVEELQPAARDRTCARTSTISVGRACSLAGRLRAVPRARRANTTMPAISSGRRTSSVARPAALERGAPRAGEPDRPGSVRSVPVVPSGRTPEGACAGQRRAADRRPALLRLAGFERRVGQPGAVPARLAAVDRASSPEFRPTISARKDSDGATRSTTGTRWPRAAIAGASTALRALLASRRRDPPRSLPRIRGGVAHTGRRADGPESGRWVPGPGADFFGVVEKALGGLPFVAEDLGIITPDVAALRDAFQHPRDARPAVRLRRPFRQPTSARQLRPEHGRLHGHARQSDDARMVRGPAGRRATAICGATCSAPRAPAADAAPALLRLAWSSVAALAIAPLQDVLNLGQGGADEPAGERGR